MLSNPCVFIFHEEEGKLAGLQNVGLRMEEAVAYASFEDGKV
jgi:hypothetical protein